MYLIVWLSPLEIKREKMMESISSIFLPILLVSGIGFFIWALVKFKTRTENKILKNVEVKKNVSERVTASSEAREHRERFIEDYEFPEWFQLRLSVEFGDLSANQKTMAIEVLKHYFLASSYQINPDALLPTPSVLILKMLMIFTESEIDFNDFCDHVFARTLHVPSQLERSPMALGPTWHYINLAEKLNPFMVNQPMPKLFRIDSELKIEGGFLFTRADCEKMKRNISSREEK